MTIAGSIFLIAVGAILRFATNVHVAHVSLHTVGLILMIAGAAGLILGFIQQRMWQGARLAPSRSRTAKSHPNAVTRGGTQMSTGLIVAIVIVALIVIALAVAASRRNRTKQVEKVQTRALHDDAAHHREQAQQARSEAELAEERAKRTAAEAELNERKADERERQLEE